jgi:hypothetical protein
MGRLFETYLGTKQGSELSPLLFEMFIDMLHELIQMQVPGAGPCVCLLTSRMLMMSHSSRMMIPLTCNACWTA